MKQAKLDEIRRQYPVSFDRLNRYSSFEQIFGKKGDEYSETERKSRWNKIMTLSTKRDKKIWSDTTWCDGCTHLNQKEAWCNKTGFPCSVNPVRSYHLSIYGTSCFGDDFQDIQPDLFYSEQREAF